MILKTFLGITTDYEVIFSVHIIKNITYSTFTILKYNEFHLPFEYSQAEVFNGLWTTRISFHFNVVVSSLVAASILVNDGWGLEWEVYHNGHTLFYSVHRSCISKRKLQSGLIRTLKEAPINLTHPENVPYNRLGHYCVNYWVYWVNSS